MSLTHIRLLATCLLVWLGVSAAVLQAQAATSDNTWVPASALPERPDRPVFALAADPTDSRRLLAGTSTGAIYVSLDAGSSWKLARTPPSRAVLSLAFDPSRTGAVVAGTRGAGIWRSADAGMNWRQASGGEGRTVRAFAFSNGVAFAGSDLGVLSSRGGTSWVGAGLSQVRVSSLAALSDGGAQGTVLAGGDASQGEEALPLYGSADGGQTWTAVAVAGPAGVIGGSSMVASLTTQGGHGLLVGTNTGLFMTADRGGSWQQLTGGGALPATDFTALATSPRHPERLYVASDGGASDQGGLWVSPDAGGHFATLSPPPYAVTALTVTADDPPTLVIATFRPRDHAVSVWTYRDAGGTPQSSPEARPLPAPTARPAAVHRVVRPYWMVLVAQPEAPYLVIGAAALVTLLVAAGIYVGRGRQL